MKFAPVREQFFCPAQFVEVIKRATDIVEPENPSAWWVAVSKDAIANSVAARRPITWGVAVAFSLDPDRGADDNTMAFFDGAWIARKTLPALRMVLKRAREMTQLRSDDTFVMSYRVENFLKE